MIEPSLLNSGIGPEKELLMKLRVLRPRISARALTSIGPERPKSERWRPVMTPLKQTTPSHVPEQGETLGIHEERERSELTRDCLRRRRDWVSVEEESEKRKKRKRRRRRWWRLTAAIALLLE